MLFRSGYLAEMEAGEIHWIDKIVAGEYSLDRRMMLNIEILDEQDISVREAWR